MVVPDFAVLIIFIKFLSKIAFYHDIGLCSRF